MKTSYLFLSITVSCVVLSSCTQSDIDINTQSINAIESSKSNLSQSGAASPIQETQIQSSDTIISVSNR